MSPKVFSATSVASVNGVNRAAATLGGWFAERSGVGGELRAAVG